MSWALLNVLEVIGIVPINLSRVPHDLNILWLCHVRYGQDDPGVAGGPIRKVSKVIITPPDFNYVGGLEVDWVLI
jgi:hypothetical protein